MARFFSMGDGAGWALALVMLLTAGILMLP